MKVPESTILGWFQQVSDLLMPLYFRLWELMKKVDYLQCDETILPVVRNDKHKTVKGYLWLVRDPMSGHQYFYWDKGSRSGEVVLKLFNGYQGALQTDGYERYELLEGKKGVILLSCWAHARSYQKLCITGENLPKQLTLKSMKSWKTIKSTKSTTSFKNIEILEMKN